MEPAWEWESVSAWWQLAWESVSAWAWAWWQLAWE